MVNQHHFDLGICYVTKAYSASLSELLFTSNDTNTESLPFYKNIMLETNIKYIFCIQGYKQGTLRFLP